MFVHPFFKLKYDKTLLKYYKQNNSYIFVIETADLFGFVNASSNKLHEMHVIHLQNKI